MFGSPLQNAAWFREWMAIIRNSISWRALDPNLLQNIEIQVEGPSMLRRCVPGLPVQGLKKTSPLNGQSTSMLNMMLGTGSPGSGLAPMLQVGGPWQFQVSIRARF